MHPRTIRDLYNFTAIQMLDAVSYYDSRELRMAGYTKAEIDAAYEEINARPSDKKVRNYQINVADGSVIWLNSFRGYGDH